MAPQKMSTTSIFRGFPLLFCLLLLYLSTETLASKCEKGQYYNMSLSKCMKCSECPVNQIVRQPCKQNEDILCGPFIGFKFSSFGQKDSDFNDHNLPSDSIIAGNRHRHGSRENKTKYMNSIEFSHLAVNAFGHLNVHNAAPNSGISGNRYDTDRGDSGRRAVTNPRVEEYERINKEDNKYWRDLSFALIAVFCLIVLVSTVVIWYLCRRCRLAGEHKITDEFDLDDADSSYVVLHHFHPVRNTYETLQAVDANTGIRQPLSLRGKRIYRPKRRLLNEYADDVFESEDSAGSKTSRRYPLQVIPENERSDSEGKDSDEAGHSSELASSENNDDTESQVKQTITAPVVADTTTATSDSSTLNGDQNNISPAQAPTVNCIIDV